MIKSCTKNSFGRKPKSVAQYNNKKKKAIGTQFFVQENLMKEPVFRPYHP
jgi:hypothetical protein